MELIKSFEELGKGDTAIAGGKGASLGEMTGAGIPVPPGYVVLSGAFERFLEETDVNVEIDAILGSVNQKEMHTVEHASEKIQGLILAAKMPDDIATEVKKYFTELNTEFVAVRSSATAEDSASAAWAGQLDSFLNTTEESLLKNVQRCWASLFTPRAIFYRFEKELHLTKISVAVVVQKMVQSEVSGIAFSVHPVTEDHNQLIIEAGFGLGEAIVSGQVTPDSYVIEKDPRRIIDINVSTQTRALYHSTIRANRRIVDSEETFAEGHLLHGQGKEPNEWIEIPEPKASSQVLTEKQILELSEIILKIENHYSFPCDIEWALEGGKFYVVQSRPITTLTAVKQETLSVKDFVLAFEGNFKTLLSEIICDGYMPQNSIILFKDSTYQQFYSKKQLKRMAEEGCTFFSDTNAVTDIIKNLEIEFTKSAKSTQDYKVSQNISEIETKSLFEIFNTINKLYGCFDFGYTDGAFELSKENPQVRYNLKLVEQYKNLFREEYNKVFFDSDCQLSTLLHKIALQYPVKADDLEWFRKEEILRLIKGELLAVEHIEKRKQFYVFISEGANAKPVFFQGDEANAFITRFGSTTIQTNSKNDIQGVTAHTNGKIVQGKVFLLHTDYGNFEKLKIQMAQMKQDDILVAPTTAPEHMDAIRKAAAIVVDVGGMLSHTAIVSRELGIPSIVGTGFASKFLKTGDMVEVDAEKGIVRIIEKSNE